MGDDRQISSQDQRSVKLRVRPPLTGTHRCHEATPTGRGIMLTVKLATLGRVSSALADIARAQWAGGTSSQTWNERALNRRWWVPSEGDGPAEGDAKRARAPRETVARGRRI